MQERNLFMNTQMSAQITPFSQRSNSNNQEKSDGIANRAKASAVYNNPRANNLVHFQPSSSSSSQNQVQSRRYPQTRNSFTKSANNNLTTVANRPRKLSSGKGENSSLNNGLYMMAHCRFLTASNYNLQLHQYDPDYPVDWDAVRLVYQNTLENQSPRCPICLDEPRCARVAKCGHQYCWPCVVRYVRYVDWDEVKDEATANHLMARGKPKSKKCAICSKWVHLESLKPVITCPAAPFHVGSNIQMNLMYRSQGSTDVISVTHDASADQVGNICIPKLAHITPMQQMEILQKDSHYLEISFNEALVDGPKEMVAICQELCLTTKNAIRMLQTTTDKLEVIGNDLTTKGEGPSTSSAASNDNESQGVITFTNSAKPIHYTDAFNDCFEAVDDKRLSLSSDGGGETDEVSSDFHEDDNESAVPVQSSNPEYFYQSSDGQHIYLFSLNWSCLFTEYGGSIEQLPKQFSAEIVQIDNMVVDEMLRKRYRYLSHLPLFCPIQFVELKLCSPLVSRKTLQKYKNGFDRRAVARKKRQWLDKKADHLMNQQLEKQQTEMLSRQMHTSCSMPQGSQKSESFIVENDFVPIVGSATLTNAVPSFTYAAKLNSFAAMASKPVAVKSSTQATSSSSNTTTKSSSRQTETSAKSDESGDDETKKAYAPPPQEGFFSRCSVSDFLVTKVKKTKKKR